MTQQLVVASSNPVKITAALEGFQQMWPGEDFTVRGVNVPSGVSTQPMTDAETRLGALNRARNAQQIVSHADYWVGIEGGAAEVNGFLDVFAWVVVLGENRMGLSRTGTFTLPEEVAQLVRAGVELGEADDRVFGRENSKQTNGAVGLLTGDLIDRTHYYVYAVILALIPFKNPALTFPVVQWQA
ncbi:MAG: inosine/xanthosine triphosphatase [bacterium]|nr:inosine/xanthosine triphosphatase [bacterium]